MVCSLPLQMSIDTCASVCDKDRKPKMNLSILLVSFVVTRDHCHEVVHANPLALGCVEVIDHDFG